MSQEEILSYINDSLVINGSFYSNQNLPNQISNAIYTFGDYNVFEILAFIDATKEQDGSRGMIITTAFWRQTIPTAFRFTRITVSQRSNIEIILIIKCFIIYIIPLLTKFFPT